MEKIIFGAIPNITLSYCWSKISHPRYFFATMKTMMIGEGGKGFILIDEKISSHGWNSTSPKLRTIESVFRRNYFDLFVQALKETNFIKWFMTIYLFWEWNVLGPNNKPVMGEIGTAGFSSSLNSGRPQPLT